MEMLTKFINQKMARARYVMLEDGTYFGNIPGFRGVWGNAKTLDACRKELQEAFEDWLVFKIHSHERVPGLNLNLGRMAVNY